MHVDRLSKGPRHHFYGYYGIQPWDATGRYHLSLETTFDDHRPRRDDVAAVGLVDRQTGQFRRLAETSAFNLQQGSMMHWIDAGGAPEFTYNDWEGDRIVARAVDPRTGRARTIAADGDGSAGIAALSPAAPEAMGLNYARMAHCRAVVGYANDWTGRVWVDVPGDDGLWQFDLRTGHGRLLLPIAEVIRRSAVADAGSKRAWFNHVVYNTDGSRLLFFCRMVRPGERFDTSLWTVGADGTGLQCQIPFGYHTSHFAWRSETRLLISTDLLGEMGFIEFDDGETNYRPLAPGTLPHNGHACFSPDGRWLVTDTSAYRQGESLVRDLLLYRLSDGRAVRLGSFGADPRYVDDIRCDLHPRWSADGRTVTFDSVYEGSRQIYGVEVGEIVDG